MTKVTHIILHLLRLITDFVKARAAMNVMCRKRKEAELELLNAVYEYNLLNKNITLPSIDDQRMSLADLKLLLKKKDFNIEEKQFVSYITTSSISLESLLFANNIRHLLRNLRDIVTKRTTSILKKWNDSMTFVITLLFGLSNTQSNTIFSAIFGSSSIRIHV